MPFLRKTVKFCHTPRPQMGSTLSQDPRSFGFPTFCPGDGGLCVSSGPGAVDRKASTRLPRHQKNWRTDHEEKPKTGAAGERDSRRDQLDLHRKSGELPSHLSRHTFALHRTDAAQI